MKKKLIFSLMLFCVVLFVYQGVTLAGITGKIAGVVKDVSTGEPLPGVNIVIEGTTMGGATDNEGHYFILNIPPGTYTLKASMVGYAIESRTGIAVSVDHTTTIDFKLRVTAIAGEEVTVIAAREIVQMDMSSSNIVADAEQVLEVPLITNIQEYIRLQAGIIGDNIRGGGLDQTEFMVDGLMMVDNRDNKPLMMVNLSSMREISIITGGFNAEYGNIRSGLINVITKEGSPSLYHGSLDYRYSPAHYKHKGPNLFSPENFFLKAYLDPAVAFVGTTNGTWDAYTQRQNLYFEGWNSYSARLLADADPSNNMTPLEAQQRFMWCHTTEGSSALGQRERPYGNKPDWIAEGSFGGPVPVIGKKLGNLSFFASYRNNWELLAMPVYNPYYKEMSTNLKLTSRLTSSMKLTLEGYYGTVNTLARDLQNGTYGYMSDGDDVYSRISAPSPTLYYPSTYGPWDIWRGMTGIAFDHVLSPSTFYNIRISHVHEKYNASHNVVLRKSLLDPVHGLDGDKTYIVKYFGNVPVDERPYGAMQYGGPLLMDDGMYMGAHSAGAVNLSGTNTLNLKFDLTSQVDKYNQVKTGLQIVYDDLSQHYEHVRWESPPDGYRIQWVKFPYRMGAYIQDKLEFEGMIANFGLRLDSNQPNTDWYDLASNPYNIYLSSIYKDTWQQLMPKKKATGHYKLSPRLGVSHPITENAKLYFNYGHFYSMPSSDLLYQYRYSWAGTITNLGNPSLLIPKTVSYELGVEYNVWELFLFHLAGYYKDVGDQTNPVSYQNFDGTVSYTTYSNQNYADIRGFEIRIDKNYGQWITGWLNYNYMVELSGYSGRYQYYEDPRQQVLYGLYTPKPTKPLARPLFRGNLSIRTPRDLGPGPTIGGAKILGYMQAGLLFTWRAGRYSTWDPLVTGKLINNVQWKDSWNLDARFAKRLQFGKYQIQVFADINNILNHDEINTLGFRSDEDQMRYMASLHLEMYNAPEYKAAGYTGGKDRPGDIGGPGTDKPYIDMPDRTSFTFLNPRSMFFGIKIDF